MKQTERLVTWVAWLLAVASILLVVGQHEAHGRDGATGTEQSLRAQLAQLTQAFDDLDAAYESQTSASAAEYYHTLNGDAVQAARARAEARKGRIGAAHANVIRYRIALERCEADSGRDALQCVSDRAALDGARDFSESSGVREEWQPLSRSMLCGSR